MHFTSQRNKEEQSHKMVIMHTPSWCFCLLENTPRFNERSNSQRLGTIQKHILAVATCTWVIFSIFLSVAPTVDPQTAEFKERLDMMVADQEIASGTHHVS